MASDSSKPALICAPCYICLEGGSDESGEPLVRDCSCRGETSAGYHLSCIIGYAKSKTRKFMESGSKLEKVQMANGHECDCMKSTWLFCPNCAGPCIGTVSMEMADAMVETTQHLPETHWVRYHALTSLVDQRQLVMVKDITFPSADSQECSPPLNEIEILLRVVEEETPALLSSMIGKQLPDLLMKEFRLCEVASLLLKKGNLLDVIGEKEEALHCFETANARLIAAVMKGDSKCKMIYTTLGHNSINKK